ncbi:MAG: RNA polymerase sigma factor SigZ [Marinifilaceae bacterium]
MVEQIWREYHKKLLGFIRNRVSDPTLAEDILQDVFIKIHSHINTLQEDRKIKAWLYQITRNTIIDYYRMNRSQEETTSIENDLEENGEGASMEDIHSCILPMINSLPESYREVLLLSELNGMSQREVADKLGISYSGAKSRVQRGRLLLKDALAQCCTFEHDSSGRVIDYQKKSPNCRTCRHDSCES